MDQCSIVRERMPELLSEALGTGERESAHQHIETCVVCEAEWSVLRQAWARLGELPDRAVPSGLRESFLDEARRMLPEKNSRVVPFAPRRPQRWLAQAAAAIILVGAAFLAGRNSAPLRLAPQDPTVQRMEPASFSLAEKAFVPASQVNPDIQGRPQIANVRFQPAGGQQVAVSFDMTSHVTITGNPEDKSLVNLLSYVLQNPDYPTHSRSSAIQWVSDTYSEQGRADADPQIVKALANVLANDTHEGVRIKAVEALKSLPASLGAEARAALVEALKNDPNPAVRMKAVEALVNLTSHDAKSLDLDAMDALREKAGQEDENPYVRVKAAEALSQIQL